MKKIKDRLSHLTSHLPARHRFTKADAGGSFQRGFTLIEIILVIALIGIASSVVITLVNPVQQFRKSNDARRKADLRQIQAAFEIYRADQGVYPSQGADPGFVCNSPLTVATTTYIQKIPCDPKNTGQFIYHYTSNGTTYTLVACIENVNDTQKDQPNAINPATGTTYCDGTTGSSYTLTNP